LSKKLNILLYGYGNPGRQDDGLGPILVELVEKWIIEKDIINISVDSNYQLNIEDAYTIRDYDIVIFMDASIEEIDDFIVTRVEPSEKVNYTMHSVSPSFVLDLCNKLYHFTPETFLLHIKGYDFQLQEGLSGKGQKNLLSAFAFIKDLLAVPEKLIENLDASLQE
jgi:hydrogenase maturation protease